MDKVKVKVLAYNEDIIKNRAFDASLGVVFFVLATAFGAYVRIPLPGNPVPITLQTMFVLLAGAVLGKRLGPLSQAGYILLGVLGIPVFQNFSFGMPYIFGPTGGYLAGFVLAAYFLGRLAEPKDSDMKSIALHFAAASMMILVFF